MVDYQQSKTILDGGGNIEALTYYLYDNRTTTLGLGDTVTGRYDGNMTLQRVYYDVPPASADIIGDLVHSTDTTYGYDTFGNQTSVLTYDGPGTLLQSGTVMTPTYVFSAPGSVTPALAATTQYETIFNTYPLTYTNQTGTGLSLVQGATWDVRMGTLQMVTDANTNATNARYDVFGRMVKLWKPGDNEANPTGEFTYEEADVPAGKPFAYRIKRRELSEPVVNGPNANAFRPSVIFYDGMGRQIQKKEESVDATQMIVTDMAYDGLDRMTAQSTPRYDNGTGAAFDGYVTPPAVSCTSGAWTCTTYDTLGRQYNVTAPDGALTKYRYIVDSNGLTTLTYDANNHRTSHISDIFGRMTKAREYSGTGGTGDAWATYATSDYTYDSLDMLTKVTDAANNQTTMTYDSAGRKTMMGDPDMGSWAYTYDVAGNLSAQTDAKNQTTVFGYDNLNRLTSKLTATNQAFSDIFTTKDTATWDWNAYQTVEITGTNTVIKNTGTGSSWDATFARKTYNLVNRQGVQLRFKLGAANTEAVFMLEADDPDDTLLPAHPRFAVYAAPDGRLRVQSSDGTDVDWKYGDLMPAVTLNQWYVLMLGIDDNGGFTAHVYPEGQPTKGASYQTMLLNARGKSWRFRNYIHSNSVYVDDYREYGGARYTYDAGTNGKGQRTSMGSPGATLSWSYDIRGRVTQTTTSDRLDPHRHEPNHLRCCRSVKTLTYPSGEQVAYTYDAAWRQKTLCSTTYSVCYADNATFDALSQPESWQLGNGLFATWSYLPASLRLGTLKVGTAHRHASGSPRLEPVHLRSGGQSCTIKEYTSAGALRETQTFGYDHRDRLTNASSNVASGTPTAYTAATFAYDTIGNLTSKGGVTFTYPASGATSVHPHAVTCSNWSGSSCPANNTYAYDANGNMESGGGGTFTWTAENQPSQIVKNSVTETYTYNADNERVKVTSGGVDTYYFGAGAEETGTTKRHVYTFNGQVIAQRDVTGMTSTFKYLHGDHLGSIVATSTSNASPTVTKQYFMPWGEARSGISQPQPTATSPGSARTTPGCCSITLGIMILRSVASSHRTPLCRGWRRARVAWAVLGQMARLARC